MDDGERSRFVEALSTRDDVHGVLSNMKGRAKRAVSQAVGRKTQPVMPEIAKCLDKLLRLNQSAEKAILEIDKLVEIARGKKKGPDLTLDDAKAKVRKLLPDLTKVDDASSDFQLLKQKYYTQAKKKNLKPDVDLMSFDIYTKTFLLRFNTFKAAVNSLK